MRRDGFCGALICFARWGNVIRKRGKPVEAIEPFEPAELIETVFQVLAISCQ